MKCHFLDLIVEIGFFVTTLEEEDFFFPLYLYLISREEDVLNSIEEEEDVDSNKIHIH
jgi:hypothetical protein